MTGLATKLMSCGNWLASQVREADAPAGSCALILLRALPLLLHTVQQ
jgi:hypothetical protein